MHFGSQLNDEETYPLTNSSSILPYSSLVCSFPVQDLKAVSGGPAPSPIPSSSRVPYYSSLAKPVSFVTRLLLAKCEVTYVDMWIYCILAAELNTVIWNYSMNVKAIVELLVDQINEVATFKSLDAVLKITEKVNSIRTYRTM